MVREFLIIAGVCFADVDTTEEQKWRQRLLDEAPSKWAQYVETIKNYGQRDDWYIVDEGGQKKRMENDVTCIETKTNVAQGGKVHYWIMAGSSKPHSLCRGYNPKYAFELALDAKADRWIITQVVLETENNYGPFIKNLEASLFGCCSLQVLDEYLPSWVSEKRLKVEKMAASKGESGQLLKIWFTNVSGEPIPRFPEKGWFVLDPQNWWVVREYDVVSRKISYHEQFEYHSDGHAIPLLKRRIETLQYPKAPSKKNRRTLREFTYQRQDSPIEEITLSAFGIPEPHGISWGRSSKTWLWFTGAGIVCGALLVLAQRYRKNTVKAHL